MRIVHMPEAYTVGACLRIRAGSTADPARPWGTAHLTEHIRIAAALDGDSGLHISGRTENAETRFTVAGLPEQTEAIVRALAGILDGGRTAGPATFDAERQAVLLEARASAADPLLLVGPAAAEAAVPGGRLADAARATADSIGRITPEDVEEFTAEHYRPESAELAVAGPIPDGEPLLAAIAETRLRVTSPTCDRDIADRPALVLPSDLDGLAVLTMPVAASDRLGRSIVRAVAARSRALGQATVASASHEVTVLCWRDRAPELAGLFADDLDWPGAARRVHQDRAFARASPLGRAQSELLPEPLDLMAHVDAIPVELRRIAGRARLWRVRSGSLHIER